MERLIQLCRLKLKILIHILKILIKNHYKIKNINIGVDKITKTPYNGII